MTRDASASVGIKPGDMVQDTYRIDQLLGEGGMGATFKGVNIATGDTVAVKVMTPQFAKVPKAVDLFKRESRLMRTVQNDAVIRYETTLQDKEGRLFLVMEYIDGKPLSAYLDRGAKLASRDVIRLGLRLADGLAAIHRLGIVHRDIAPDNIMIPDEDVHRAKLIDFGLASDTTGSDKSIIGDTFAGKYNYSAPEQFGLFGARVTPATDIYSLGLVLMRVAGLPVPGQGQGIAALDDRRVDVVLPEATGLDRPLRLALEVMLKAKPEERSTDLAALLQKALFAIDGVKSTNGTATDAAPRAEAKGKPALLLAGAAAALVALGGAGAYFGGLLSPATPPVSAEVADARAMLQSDDPLAEISARIDQGGDANLNAAFGSLMALTRDTGTAPETRQRAFLMMAAMYDPVNFDPKRSPFREPEANAARRHYQSAADLGSEEALTALARLPKE